MLIDTAHLKANVDLAALIEADLGPACRKRGRWLFWRCPFHEDHNPSLAVTPDTGTWHCFGCGRSGDAISWLQERENLTFREACERLGGLPELPAPPRRTRAARREMPAPPPADWQERARAVVDETTATLWGDQGVKARAWLQKRGIQQETLRAWRIGYNPADREIAGLFVPRGIVIPCFAEGKTWYLKVRRPVPPLPGPKYRQVKGGQYALYGLDHLEGKDAVLICEGEFDALLAWQEAGDLVDVVALGSATARPSPAFQVHLLGAAHWLVATDRDEAGERGAGWWSGLSARVRRIQPLEGKDLTDFHRAGGDLRAWVTYHLERIKAETRPTATSPEVGDVEAEAERLLALADRMDPGAWAREWAALAKRAGWPCHGLDWDTWADPLLRRCVEELGAVVAPL